MVLLGCLGDKAPQIPIQFLGTDVSETSVTRARNGVYPENIQGDVSPERLRRFFTKVDGGYRISKAIRDICIIAQHNLLSDAAFSRMELMWCRNVLIYLEAVLQGKVISLLHYALRPGGYLVLGSSEGVGATARLFAVEDRTHKIFSNKSGTARQVGGFSLHSEAGHKEYGPMRVATKQTDSIWNYGEAQKEFDRRLLTQYTPATVFVNEDMEIIHTRGNVNRSLKLTTDRPSSSTLKMAREGLDVELRNAIVRATHENVIVGKRNLQVKFGNGDGAGSAATDSARLVNFDVIPVALGNMKELYFMIVFQEAPLELPRESVPRRARPSEETESALRRSAKLEQELAAAKE